MLVMNPIHFGAVEASMIYFPEDAGFRSYSLSNFTILGGQLASNSLLDRSSVSAGRHLLMRSMRSKPSVPLCEAFWICLWIEVQQRPIIHALTCSGGQTAMQGRLNNWKPYVGSMNFPGFGKAADDKKVLNMGLDVYWLSKIPAVERVKEFAIGIGSGAYLRSLMSVALRSTLASKSLNSPGHSRFVSFPSIFSHL